MGVGDLVIGLSQISFFFCYLLVGNIHKYNIIIHHHKKSRVLPQLAPHSPTTQNLHPQKTPKNKSPYESKDF